MRTLGVAAVCALLTVPCAVLLSGCGGSLSSGAGNSGTLSFDLGGLEGRSRVPTGMVVTIDRIDLRPTGSTEYQTYWTGSREVDLFDTTPSEFTLTVNLGEETTGTFDSIRFHASHIVITDPDEGDTDEDVDATAAFSCFIRVDKGRLAALRMAVSPDSVVVNGSEVDFDEDAIREDNGLSEGEEFQARWRDAAILDLTHLDVEVPLPNDEVATGLWLNGDATGAYVETSDVGGVWYEFYEDWEQEDILVFTGTFTYDDASKQTGAWEYVDSFGNVYHGTFRTFQDAMSMTSNAWHGMIVPENSQEEGAKFAIFHLDAQGDVDEFYPGDVIPNDPENLLLGGTFTVFPAEYVMYYGPYERPSYEGTVTVENRAHGGWTFTEAPEGAPTSGTWVTYWPED